MKAAPNPKRTVTELKELRELTGDENGAQRVAFTPTWAKARAWLRQKLAELPAEIHTDEAGNLWATLHGESGRALLIGGAHRFGAEWRLARWLPEYTRRCRDSSPHQYPIQRQAAGNSAPRGLHRRRRRSVWEEPLRFIGVLGSPGDG